MAELDFSQPIQPTSESILEFINSHSSVTTEAIIFRNFRAKGSKRKYIRTILKGLEDDGMLKKTSSKSFISNVNFRPQCEVVIVSTDNVVYGRAIGRKGIYGPKLKIVHSMQQSSSAKLAELSVDDRVFCRINKRRHQWEATVMKNIQPQETQQLIGEFSKKDPNETGVIFPSNYRYREPILVSQKYSKTAKDGDLVQIDYDIAGRFNRKHITNLRVVGRRTDPSFPHTIALLEHELTDEFPKDVREQLSSLKQVQCERTDFTHKKLITIDPEDARDHDDAVYAERNSDGWTIIVAIADVASYVPNQSPIDIEAQKRGNSTYFPNRVIPMLPTELSNDLCSLRPQEVRPSILVEMKFNLSGQKQSHKFYRANIKSAGNLTYRDAQNAIDGKPCSELAKSLLKPVLKPLWNAFRSLKEAQSKRDPMAITSSECQFEFNENGTVSHVETKRTLEAHKLIEELMIQANVSAAESLANCGIPILFRVHDKPKRYKVEAFMHCVKGMGFDYQQPTTIKKSKFFNDLFRQSGDPQQTLALSEAVLRCQSQAKYDVNNIGHFGLNLMEYVHFTSPIRRYSDLIIHRALISALKLGTDGTTETDVRKIKMLAQYLHATERQSIAAERETTERYLAAFYEGKERSRHKGFISGVTEHGLFVKLIDTSATGYVPIRALRAHYWRFNRHQVSLENRHKAKKYCFGQLVEVEIIEVDSLSGKMELKMLSVPIDFTPEQTKVKPEDKMMKKKKLSRRLKRRQKQQNNREGNA